MGARPVEEERGGILNLDISTKAQTLARAAPPVDRKNPGGGRTSSQRYSVRIPVSPLCAIYIAADPLRLFGFPGCFTFGGLTDHPAFLFPPSPE